MSFNLYQGDCLDTLRNLPDNSVDSIVTDPPYGLTANKKGGTGVASVNLDSPYGRARIGTGNGAGGFMGHKWDSDVPSVEVWAECLRVLKPGGHLLAFAGTRTQHRMAVRIEDAGFEIRDMIAWVYGSGFPKSLDVSKALDKMDAAEEQEQRRLKFTAWVRSQGVTSRQIDEATGTNMGGHYTTVASQPAIMTREHLEACRHLFREVPEWVEREADQRTVESENFKRREVIGQDTKARSTSGASALPTMGGETVYQSWGITTPATDAARQWQGWGTALKPALEPITVARKPLVGTVAENVLAHGTGALNIDGCRVHADDAQGGTYTVKRFAPGASVNKDGNWKQDVEFTGEMKAGRWPANLIHDGSDEVLALAGDAARFFYCPKASRADRNEGTESLPQRVVSTWGGEDYDLSDGKKSTIPKGNHHPTVKPTDLMAYLCRLVTPPGGVVLDPFMGSGSTGKAAMREGFHFIGCELSPEYMEIARARIVHALCGDLA